MKKALQFFVSLAIINCSCAMGMEPKKREDFLSTLLNESIAKSDQQVLSELNKLPHKKAMPTFNKVVERHKLEMQTGKRNSFSWNKIRNDLEKVRQKTIESQKQSTKKLCIASTYYAAQLFLCMSDLSGSGEQNTLGALFVLANIIHASSSFVSWISLMNLQRQNDFKSFVMNYVCGRSNDQCEIVQLINSASFSGKIMSQCDYDKLKDCVLRPALSTDVQKVKKYFAPSYSYSMSDSQRKVHGLAILLNCFPFLAVALTTHNPEVSLMKNVGLAAHAMISLISGLCILNGGLLSGDPEMEKSLDDIIATIDKYA